MSKNRAPKSIDHCYTKEEAAKRLSVSMRTIDRMRERGELQGWKLATGGNQVWFKKEDIETLTQNLVEA